jgi:hypothetical protein
MYVSLLRRSLDAWSDEFNNDDLLEHVLGCRLETLAVAPHREGSVYSALAAEVGYDRALIKLCEAHGISASPEHFDKPTEERRRLELALFDDGVDLTDLSRRRRT